MSVGWGVSKFVSSVATLAMALVPTFSAAPPAMAATSAMPQQVAAPTAVIPPGGTTGLTPGNATPLQTDNAKNGVATPTPLATGQWTGSAKNNQVGQFLSSAKTPSGSWNAAGTTYDFGFTASDPYKSAASLLNLNNSVVTTQGFSISGYMSAGTQKIGSATGNGGYSEGFYLTPTGTGAPTTQAGNAAASSGDPGGIVGTGIAGAVFAGMDYFIDNCPSNASQCDSNVGSLPNAGNGATNAVRIVLGTSTNSIPDQCGGLAGVCPSPAPGANQPNPVAKGSVVSTVAGTGGTPISITWAPTKAGTPTGTLTLNIGGTVVTYPSLTLQSAMNVGFAALSGNWVQPMTFTPTQATANIQVNYVDQNGKPLSSASPSTITSNVGDTVGVVCSGDAANTGDTYDYQAPDIVGETCDHVVYGTSNASSPIATSLSATNSITVYYSANQVNPPNSIYAFATGWGSGSNYNATSGTFMQNVPEPAVLLDANNTQDNVIKPPTSLPSLPTGYYYSGVRAYSTATNTKTMYPIANQINPSATVGTASDIYAAFQQAIDGMGGVLQANSGFTTMPTLNAAGTYYSGVSKSVNSSGAVVTNNPSTPGDNDDNSFMVFITQYPLVTGNVTYTYTPSGSTTPTTTFPANLTPPAGATFNQGTDTTVLKGKGYLTGPVNYTGADNQTDLNWAPAGYTITVTAPDGKTYPSLAAAETANPNYTSKLTECASGDQDTCTLNDFNFTVNVTPSPETATYNYGYVNGAPNTPAVPGTLTSKGVFGNAVNPASDSEGSAAIWNDSASSTPQIPVGYYIKNIYAGTDNSTAPISSSNTVGINATWPSGQTYAADGNQYYLELSPVVKTSIWNISVPNGPDPDGLNNAASYTDNNVAFGTNTPNYQDSLIAAVNSAKGTNLTSPDGINYTDNNNGLVYQVTGYTFKGTPYSTLAALMAANPTMGLDGQQITEKLALKDQTEIASQPSDALNTPLDDYLPARDITQATDSNGKNNDNDLTTINGNTVVANITGGPTGDTNYWGLATTPVTGGTLPSGQYSVTYYGLNEAGKAALAASATPTDPAAFIKGLSVTDLANYTVSSVTTLTVPPIIMDVVGAVAVSGGSTMGTCDGSGQTTNGYTGPGSVRNVQVTVTNGAPTTITNDDGSTTTGVNSNVPATGIEFTVNTGSNGSIDPNSVTATVDGAALPGFDPTTMVTVSGGNILVDLSQLTNADGTPYGLPVGKSIIVNYQIQTSSSDPSGLTAKLDVTSDGEITTFTQGSTIFQVTADKWDPNLANNQAIVADAPVTTDPVANICATKTVSPSAIDNPAGDGDKALMQGQAYQGSDSLYTIVISDPTGKDANGNAVVSADAQDLVFTDYLPLGLIPSPSWTEADGAVCTTTNYIVQRDANGVPILDKDGNAQPLLNADGSKQLLMHDTTYTDSSTGKQTTVNGNVYQVTCYWPKFPGTNPNWTYTADGSTQPITVTIPGVVDANAVNMYPRDDTKTDQDYNWVEDVQNSGSIAYTYPATQPDPNNPGSTITVAVPGGMTTPPTLVDIVQQVPDLFVSKAVTNIVSDKSDSCLPTKCAGRPTDMNAYANPGDTVTWQVNTVNNGLGAAINPTVTDYVPAYVTITGFGVNLSNADGSTPSCNAYTATVTLDANGKQVWTQGDAVTLPHEGPLVLTCKVTGSIPADKGATVLTMTVTGTVDQVEGHTNITNGASTGSDSPDGNLADNNATPANIIVLPVADLGITKTGPKGANPLDPITYNFQVWNQGPTQVDDAVVTDQVPEGIIVTGAYQTSTDAGGNPVKGDPVNCTLADGSAIPAGGVAGPATLLCYPGGGTLKVGSEDTAIKFTLEGSVAAGATGDENGIVTNSASIASSGVAQDDGKPIPDPSDSGTDGAADNSDTAETAISLYADLWLTKSGPLEEGLTVYAGSTGLEWDIAVGNRGPSDVSDAVVTDDIPAGITVTATPDGCTLPDGAALPLAGPFTLTCAVGALANGADTTDNPMVIKFDVDSDYVASGKDNPLVNSATITSSLPDVPATDDNPDAKGDGPTPNTDAAETPVETQAAVYIAKTASPCEKAGSDECADDAVGTVNAGENIIWVVTVGNKAGEGISTAQNVSVTDALPAGVTVVQAEGDCSLDSGSLNWTIGDLTAGAEKTCTITGQVDPSYDPTTGSVVNIATVNTDTDQTAGWTGPFTEQTSTPVKITPGLWIAKSATSEATEGVAGPFYWINAGNHGPSAIKDAVVTDPIPAEITVTSIPDNCQSDAALPAAGPTITCTLGDLGAGEDAASIVITAFANSVPANPVANIATVSGTESDGTTDSVPSDNSNGTGNTTIQPAPVPPPPPVTPPPPGTEPAPDPEPDPVVTPNAPDPGTKVPTNPPAAPAPVKPAPNPANPVAPVAPTTPLPPAPAPVAPGSENKPVLQAAPPAPSVPVAVPQPLPPAQDLAVRNPQSDINMSVTNVNVTIDNRGYVADTKPELALPQKSRVMPLKGSAGNAHPATGTNIALLLMGISVLAAGIPLIIRRRSA